LFNRGGTGEGKLENTLNGKRSLDSQWIVWEDNIKIDLMKIFWEKYGLQ
jgi:hypothetical protein